MGREVQGRPLIGVDFAPFPCSNCLVTFLGVTRRGRRACVSAYIGMKSPMGASQHTIMGLMRFPVERACDC